MAMTELLDKDQRQHPVAEELEALVVGILGSGGAGMGERHGEEIGILEAIAEPVLNRCCRIGFQGTPQRQWTRVNKRFQRTAKGQSQNW